MQHIKQEFTFILDQKTIIYNIQQLLLFHLQLSGKYGEGEGWFWQTKVYTKLTACEAKVDQEKPASSTWAKYYNDYTRTTPEKEIMKVDWSIDNSLIFIFLIPRSCLLFMSGVGWNYNFS